MLLFIILTIFSFVVQEKSTRKYIAADSQGIIAMVDTPEEATRFEIHGSLDKTINTHIAMLDSKKVFDMGIDHINVMLKKSNNSPTQLFQINLDKNGYFQISQDEKFLRYDSITNGLIIDDFNPGWDAGFLLYDNSGVLPYAPPLNRGIESPYRKRPISSPKVSNILIHNLRENSNAYKWLLEGESYFTEKNRKHDFGADERQDGADKHAQEHNASQKFMSDFDKMHIKGLRQSVAVHEEINNRPDRKEVPVLFEK